jgi:hypothetical protein
MELFALKLSTLLMQVIIEMIGIFDGTAIDVLTLFLEGDSLGPVCLKRG